MSAMRQMSEFKIGDRVEMTLIPGAQGINVGVREFYVPQTGAGVILRWRILGDDGDAYWFSTGELAPVEPTTPPAEKPPAVRYVERRVAYAPFQWMGCLAGDQDAMQSIPEWLTPYRPTANQEGDLILQLKGVEDTHYAGGIDVCISKTLKAPPGTVLLLHPMADLMWYTREQFDQLFECAPDDAP